MASDFYDVGELLPDLDPDKLEYEESRRLLAACVANSAFSVRELRRVVVTFNGNAQTSIDGIVVDCCDGTVPSRNEVGIKNRERLLLTYDPSSTYPHGVRPMRKGFPATPHQNHVLRGDPASICLYFEPWNAVERMWTPERHLQRILWWLREAAQGTLHRNDQPLERLYFVSEYQLVLPFDFRERAATHPELLDLFSCASRPGGKVLRGLFRAPGAAAPSNGYRGWDTVVATVPRVVSTRVEKYPSTLGELHGQLTQHGSELLAVLRDALKKKIPSAGLPGRDSRIEHVLLLIQIPVARQEHGSIERIDVTGFIVLNSTIASLGVACGAAFDGKNGRVYANSNLGFLADEVSDGISSNWSELSIEPIDVRFESSAKEARRASGIDADKAEFHGVLAGVGALGSTLAEIWYRERWGKWTFIDDDVLLPHNVARHSGINSQIGWAKVDVVAKSVGDIWADEEKPKTICALAANAQNTEIQAAMTNASIFVDATTTLDVPRDLSDRDGGPRMASVFLTPSGSSSVLLLEDTDRTQALSGLEAQYYRAVINSDWGELHLVGHQGSYWVGAGCRDISSVLPQEMVQLHGAILARHVRLLSSKPQAEIRVWSLDLETGAVTAQIIEVEPIFSTVIGNWRVDYDQGVVKKLKALRENGLPSETGGVILGYADQKRKTIHVVDVMSAPADSIASSSEFIRGAAGLPQAIERASARTSNIVEYIGEWHSHPKDVSSMPSATDAALLASLAHSLAADGVPALMMIVGESDMSMSLGDGGICEG